MDLIRASLSDPVVEPVLHAIRLEYDDRYGPGDHLGDAGPTDFEPPGGVLLLVVDDAGRAVSAGGLRRVDDETCEIKRMWTDPGQRRRGHARRILAALESFAAEAGYASIRLATGTAQPEAVAMYLASGYEPRSADGPRGAVHHFLKLLPR